MIRSIVKLGQWLDSRFPAKIVMTEAAFDLLLQDISRLKDNVLSLNELERRLAVVEKNAVHKGAVQDMIKVVAELKADYTSFKASAGFTPVKVSPELQAMLNGEYIAPEESHNG